MASNYQLRKALYKQIKSKDLEVSITASSFFRLVKLDDATFLLNIDIQTNKGNITIKGLTKGNFNSYNTTSDIELSVSADNTVYVKNTSTNETIITSTSLELVKGILNESYFDLITADPGAVVIFNSKTDQGTFNVVDGSSSRINSDVSSFSDKLYVHGESVLNDTLTVNGESVLNDTLIVNGLTTVDSIGITNNTAIGGSLGVTGATTLGNTLSVAGNLSVNNGKFSVEALSGNTNIAGDLSVTNKFNVEALTGNTNIAGYLDVIGVLDVTGATNLTTLKTSGIANIHSLEVDSDSLFEGNVDINGTLNVDGAVTLANTLEVTGLITGNLQGNADTATALETARAIGGVSFDGTIDINLPGVNITGNQDTTGNAGSATKLETPRTIGGVSFDGTTNINLPGVNITGDQDTTGNAATATALETPRTIGGVIFDGTEGIDLPGVNTIGNQDTTGNAATATALETPRTIGGVIFDGTADINLPGVNITGDQDTTGNAATATKLETARTINGTPFDGSENITTNTWGTSRNITIGTGPGATKSVNGSTTYSWNHADIGINNPTITITAGSGLITGGDFTLNQAGNKTITLNHSNSVTAGNVGPTINPTPGFGGTFNTPYISYDAQGHITGTLNRTTTIPSTLATTSSIGLVGTGAQTFGGNKTFANNVVISGDLTVQGENFIANTTTITTEDDVIELRSNGVGPISTPAGIVIKKYDGTNDGGIVIKNDGEVRVGKVELGVDGAIINSAEAQPVLTRDERINLTTDRILMWSGDNKATNLGVGTAGQFLLHNHTWGGLTSPSQGVVTIGGVNTNLTDLLPISTPTFAGIKTSSIEPISNDLVIGTESSTTQILGELKIDGTDLTIIGTTIYNHIKAETISGIDGGEELAITGNLTGNATSSTNADKLDNQHGSYYLDWTNTTNKPDPKITLAGDLSGEVTLTDLGSGTLTATIAPNSVALGTDTTGNYVATVSGIANGGLSISGSGSENSAVTIGHSNILGAAGSQSGSSGAVAFGGTISIPSISYDINGHITSTTTTSVTLPTNPNTWRPVEVNNVSIGTNTLDLTDGTNVTVSNTSGVVTFSSPSLTKAANVGTGSFVTDVSVSGHTITLSKGNFTETTLSKVDATGDYMSDITVSGHTITEVKSNFSTLTISTGLTGSSYKPNAATTMSLTEITPGTSQTTQGALWYHGITPEAGKFDGSTTNPSGTTRLNYGGYLYATRLYDNGSRVLTAHPYVAAATSVNNSGRTYIQDITLDSFGHITGIVSGTETVTNTITNISITHNAGNVVVNSSDGNNGTINGATTSAAGVITTGAQTFGGNKTFDDNVTVKGNLTVEGDINVSNVNVIETSNGIIFEGITADAYETTLRAIDPTADRLIELPNADGTVALIENLPEGKGIKIEESSLVWDSASESLKFVFT